MDGTSSATAEFIVAVPWGNPGNSGKASGCSSLISIATRRREAINSGRQLELITPWARALAFSESINYTDYD